MSDELLNRIASANLSRVDCHVCGGRLYTQHKPGCPVLLDEERRTREFAEMAAGYFSGRSGTPTGDA